MSTVAVREAAPGAGPAVRALLEAAGLPVAGLDDAWKVWTANTPDGAVVGAVALERHPDADLPGGAAFLLRSLVVDPGLRSSGVGRALVETALDAARKEAGSPAVALLTETADGYFDRFGFVAVPREGLPAALGASAELTGACPASARAYLLAR